MCKYCWSVRRCTIPVITVWKYMWNICVSGTLLCYGLQTCLPHMDNNIHNIYTHNLQLRFTAYVQTNYIMSKHHFVTCEKQELHTSNKGENNVSCVRHSHCASMVCQVTNCWDTSHFTPKFLSYIYSPSRRTTIQGSISRVYKYITLRCRLWNLCQSCTHLNSYGI